jgi:NADH-quinone oxidoreductase subunit M
VADLHAPLLWLLLVLPLLAAALVPLLPRAVGRVVAFAVMGIVLVLTSVIFARFDGGADAPQLQVTALASLAGGVSFGVDAVNIYLLLLTALLFPAVLLGFWSNKEADRPLYLALLFVLQAFLFGTFLAQDLIAFFVCWEAVLLPMLLLILVFGGAERRRAGLVFFLYTVAGSVLLLAAVILLGVEHLNTHGYWSFRFEDLYGLHLSPAQQWFVFTAVALACAIKSPLVPLHSWLPLAYTQAPAAGTALMAGLLSKMGAFGFIKLAVPLAPDVASQAAPVLVLVAVMSVLYGALLALREDDFRRLIAYASLSHMGFIVLGVFSFQQTAVHGAMLQMLSHGVVVAGLFMLLGLLERRQALSTVPIDALATRAPRLAVVAMLFILASLGLPLTSGFSAEFMILLGAFQEGWSAWLVGQGALRLVVAVLACAAVVLGAAYMLRFARALLFSSQGHARLPDLGWREGAAFAPLLGVVFWAGLWPAPLLQRAQPAAAYLSGFSVGWRPAAAVSAVLPPARADAPEAAAGEVRTHGR